MKKIAILAGIAVLSFLIVVIPGYFLVVSRAPADKTTLENPCAPSAMNPCVPK